MATRGVKVQKYGGDCGFMLATTEDRSCGENSVNEEVWAYPSSG